MFLSRRLRIIIHDTATAWYTSGYVSRCEIAVARTAHNYRISDKLPLVRSTVVKSRRMNNPSKRLKTVAAAGVVKEVPTTPVEGQKTGTSGLRKKAAIFSSGNYLANWVQALFCALQAMNSRCSMVLGGDGRWFNKEAAQIIIKLAAGNG